MDPVPAYAEGGILFARDLTYPELARRFESGAQVSQLPSDGGSPSQAATARLMFIVGGDGELRPAVAGDRVEAQPGETSIWLAERSAGELGLG
jgi:hypothetical protein